MMKTSNLSLLLASVLFVSILASPAYAQSIPKVVPYVNDYSGVLSQADAAAINGIAQQIEQNSTVQVAVLIVDSTQPSDIATFANQAFRQSGIGHKDNNNGLLLVLAVKDREWRIEVGYGLEGVLNDAKVGDIGRTYLVPNFQNGDYGTGIILAMQSIASIVETGDDFSLVSQQQSQTGFDYGNIAYIGIFLLFAILPMISRLFPQREKCPKCGTKNKGADAGDGENMAFVCKKCGTRYRKKKKRGGFMFFPLVVGGFGGGGGGGGFGGGSSGGGGAGGKF